MRIQSQQQNFCGFNPPRNKNVQRKLAATLMAGNAKEYIQENHLGIKLVLSIAAGLALLFYSGKTGLKEEAAENEFFKNKKAVAIKNYIKVEPDTAKQSKTLNLLNITKDDYRWNIDKLTMEMLFLNEKTDSILLSDKFGADAVKDLHPTIDFVSKFKK